jgi:hypothetical protein
MASESGRERTVTVLLGFALMVAGCGGTELSQTTGPTPVKCQTALTGMPASLAASGGRLNATLATTRECAWTASSDVPWVTVKPATGQGDASLSVVVAENTVAASRSGAILVNDGLVRFTQQAAPCRFALDSSSARVGSQGGPVAISVSATAGCTWTASTEAAWVRTLTTRGTGSGTAEFSVQPNDGAERRATLTVAGLTMTVTQASATGGDPTPPPAPDPDPDPAPPSPDPSPGPEPEPVSFKGRVSSLSGLCPSLTFTADDRQVSTDAQTRFTHGNCDDMRNGIEVDIDGDVLASGVILASKVELKDNDDGEDDDEDGDDDGGDDGR